MKRNLGRIVGWIGLSILAVVFVACLTLCAMFLYDKYGGYAKANIVDYYQVYRVARSLRWDAITMPVEIDGIGTKAYLVNVHWMSGGLQQFQFSTLEDAQTWYNLMVRYHAPGPEEDTK